MKHLFRILRYVLVGGVSTAIQYATLILLVRGLGMAPTPASCLGFVLSASVNYLLNYRFTFQSNRPHRPAAAKFAVLAVAGLLLNAIVMWLMTRAAVNYLIAQICATGLVLLWGYLGNSIWTFGSGDVAEQTRN